MKKFFTFLIVAMLAFGLFAMTGCRSEETPVTPPPAPPPQQQGTTPTEQPPAPTPAPPPSDMELLGLDENGRFLETVQLSVLIWNRNNDRQPDMGESGWADHIREVALRDLNIAVTFEEVSRWDEGPMTATLVGSSSAPDVTFHFGGQAVTNSWAEMGAILDLAPLLATYGGLLPDLYDWLGPLVYYDALANGSVFALPSRRVELMRQNVFIREDWLNILSIPVPTTLQEFEDALVAFRDNAELLLGPDADMMIPLLMDGDAGWALGTVIDSFIPDSITEREWFRYGFDDRRIMHPTTKEAIRVANRWFHMDLMFNEFAYGEAGDLMPGFVREGFVGAQIANWDMPFRGGGDLQIVSMRENVGPEANFIAINPFPNDAGNSIFFLHPQADRRIVIPHTASNPLASLMYMNLMSRQDMRDFLAFGIEGVHHEVMPDGAIRLFHNDQMPDNFVITSANNFDINFMSNGFELATPDLTVATLALGYPGIEPEAIMAARINASIGRSWRSVTVRPIDAQEGMTVPLREFRDTVLHNTITAPVADFDAVWDNFISQYMQMGGQAIINERDQAWVETFGPVDFMPGWTGW